MTALQLQAPFPWFGGKRHAADAVWAALGDVASYVEPFCGSMATLLARDEPCKAETVNDADGLLVNAWRSIQWSPEQTAKWADWPVSEADLQTRHLWLVKRADEITRRVTTDPEWHDPKAAGWWIWGHCSWIAGGFCSGSGPWDLASGEWVKRPKGTRPGISRALPRLSSASGVHRKTLGPGRRLEGIRRWFDALSARLERVRITCGDWTRVLSRAAADPQRNGRVGVFLDPPYPVGSISYAGGGGEVWHEVVSWAASAPPEWRVVVAGYAGTWEPPEGWTERRWKHRGGFGSKRGRTEERLWCSPSCEPKINLEDMKP